MVLLIDIGNTIGKAVLYHPAESNTITMFDPEHPVELKQLLQGKTHIVYCLIAAVREIPDVLLNFLRPLTKIYILDAQWNLPFQHTYKTPATLGPDRIAAVAAAWKKFPDKNVLVIDMGTCITYDFLDKNATYHGGAISPGVQMRFRAMHHFTGKLPLLKPNQKVSLVGDSTDASMQSGVLNGIQAEIEGIIYQYEQLYEDLTVIIGGGDNKYFDKKFKINIFAGSNLVLEGLKVIVDFNDIR
jgi:type III pantothenate kinase